MTRETVAQRRHRDQCRKDARTAMIGIACVLIGLIGTAWAIVSYVEG